MLEITLTSIVSYVATNIDDIFINTIFYSTADTKRRTRAVTVGVYLGMAVLVSISLAGALGLALLPDRIIGLLGFVPISLGIKEILEYREEKTPESDGRENSTRTISVTGVMLVTVANGADNIGVYVPLFAGYSPIRIITAVAVFAVMTSVMCLVAKKLSDMPLLRGFLTKYKHIIVPAVYVTLGAYIILKTYL